jgi:hypothetical protein
LGAGVAGLSKEKGSLQIMRKLAVMALLLVGLALTAAAQANTGRLVGTVSDASGVIQGASVVVKDSKTNKERTATTNDDGSFMVSLLDPGSYTVTITAQGRKTFTANDVKIDVGQEYSLNPTLEVGGVNETVTVTAGADVVNSTNAELSTTVSPRQVLELPINGRNPLALLNLIAGGNPTSASINGQRSSSANFTRDGINVQDNFIRTGGFVQDRPTVDDTGEFTVVTQNAAADQGNGGSTQVQLVTPRGGADFHGALWEYNRNSRFAANTFFNNSSNTRRPFLNRNQFGGKVSGPLALPSFGGNGAKLARGKAFFFAQYERFELRQQAALTRTVLLGSARAGNFTYTDNAGVTRTVNVLNGAGLTGPIPASAGGVLAVDPVIQRRFLDNSPATGNGVVANNGLTQQFLFNQADNDRRNGLTGRLDVDLNERHSLYFVGKYNDNADDRQVDGGGFAARPYVIQGGPTNLFVGTYRSLFGSRFNNEVRGAYAFSKPFFKQNSLPTDYIIGALPLGLTNPEASFENQGRNTKQYTVQDNASYAFGNHALRFGGQYEAQRIESITNFNRTAIYNISTAANPNTPRLAATLYPGGISATQRARADALRYLLGGIVGGGTLAANFVNPSTGPQFFAPVRQKFEYDTYGLYVGDQWRVTPRLTLNLGLRYDLFTPLTNPDQVYLEPALASGQSIVDAITNPNGNYALLGTNLGRPGQFFRADKNNFGPNIGVAYTPEFEGNFLRALFPAGGKTVLRGGFRISYVNDEYTRSADNAAAGNAGLNLTVPALSGGSASLNARFNSLPGFVLPAFAQPPISYATGNANAGNFFNTVFAIDPNIQIQRATEYNFGLQRELGGQMVAEVRYVGSYSNNLWRGVDFNQVNLNANGFLADFLRARENCRLQGGGNLQNCTDASFNPAIPGSQPLPVFAMLPFGAFLNNSAVTAPIINGNPADLAVVYIINGLDVNRATGAGVNFRRNFNAGPVDLLQNGGRYRFNALQAELRRRFVDGFSFQINYTFQKTLSDITGDTQARFDPYLDNANPNFDYARPDYDRAHTVNFNGIYELPFGKNKRWFNEGGAVDRLLGGFQFSSIVNVSSGPPLSIRDAGNGTLNRAGRSARQAANSSLSLDQIKDLIGIYRQNGRIYFINPAVIAADGTATGGNLGTTPGSAFPGQVFFRAQPGQTGSLGRAFINGPLFVNWDAGLIKNVRLTERSRLQLRWEIFNVLNRANFLTATGGNGLSLGEDSPIFNINSPTFGQITNTAAPRIMQFAFRLEF